MKYDKNLDPFRSWFFEDETDAYGYLNLCTEANLELNEMLSSLADNNNDEKTPLAIIELINSVQRHFMDCYRMKGVIEESLKESLSEES